MGFRSRLRLPLVVLLSLLIPGGPTAQQTAAPDASTGAKIWVGRYQEFETLLKTAEITRKQERLPVGVTAPTKIALAPGGPIQAIAWKPIRPGMYRGFYESYKSEIAAYELDKLFGLDMVPPYVERRINGEVGAAAMWLKDDAWNVILIDHSRSFTTSRAMTHQLAHVDRALWTRMLALDEPALTKAIGAWAGRGEIRAILQRRDAIKKLIDKLVAEKGEAQVFIDA